MAPKPAKKDKPKIQSIVWTTCPLGLEAHKPGSERREQVMIGKAKEDVSHFSKLRASKFDLC